MKGYLTTAEAAAKNRLSARRVSQLCAQGSIPGAKKFGRDWMIPATYKWVPVKPGPKPKEKSSKKPAGR